MTQLDQELRDKELRNNCTVDIMHPGCEDMTSAHCRFCGFNKAECDKRIRRGMVVDPDTGLHHYVPTKKGT